MAEHDEGNLDDTSNMDKRKVNKRRRVVTTPDHVTAPLDFAKGLINLLEIPEDKLAEFIGGIANHGKITTAAIKKARTTLPLFPALKWTDVVEKFGLPYVLEESTFHRFVAPIYSLPPSVHEIMFEAAWRTEDAYRERLKWREVTRVRIMDPYLVRIIGLFQGRVIDKPEHEYVTERAVEHEIFMIGRILFIIAEYKFYMDLEDNVAQLFTEMLAAAKANERADFANLRIYGLITNLDTFHFYSYDPVSKKFAFDVTMLVNVARDMAFTDMIPVGNKIFGVILTAYIDGLEATTLKNIERKNKGNVSSPSPMPLQQLRCDLRAPSKSHARERGRKSTDCWEVALQLARECRDKFNEPVDTVDDIERNSTAALELLAKSVRSIPRASYFTGAENPSSMEEIKDLARRAIHKKYLDMLHGIYYY